MSDKPIAPCKFCGEAKELKAMDCGDCWVECDVCKARGPIALFKDLAIANWNGENKELGKKR